MDDKKFDVVGVEDLIMDLSLLIRELPATDGFTQLYDFSWQSGGNAASAIIALARLGASCGMAGTAGTDAFGTFCAEDMRRHGVDTSRLHQNEGETTLCVDLAEKKTGGRSFLGKMGTARSLLPEQLDEAYIRTARVVHLSILPTKAQQAAIGCAKKNGVTISLDAGGWMPDADRLAAQTDILIMSESFYRGLYGDSPDYAENCRRFLARGPHTVIVTLGGRGCAGADAAGETFVLPPFSGHEIVDTTGAGDVFHGGFLYAWLYRRAQAPYRYSLRQCARFASAVSYINCLTLGGRAGIPTLPMVDRFLQDGTVLPGDIAQRSAFYRDAVFRPHAAFEWEKRNEK